jgi:hypothetical protein
MIAPSIPWDEMDFLIAEEIEEFRKIKSGVHIALLGTTRGGKTTVATGGGNSERGILRHFEDALILDTTGDPGAISSYGKPLAKIGSIRGHRRLTVTDMSNDTKVKVHKAISKAVKQGNVAIYADELRQLCDKKYFGLGPMMDYLWLFTAKRGVSLIGGSQAPRWLPGAFYDQSKIHLVFGVRDKRSRIRLSEIGGDTETLLDTIPNLKRYEFAHVGLDGDVLTSKFQLVKPTKTLRTTDKVVSDKSGDKRIRFQKGSASGLTPTR